jgi:hypothetical protein
VEERAQTMLASWWGKFLVVVGTNTFRLSYKKMSRFDNSVRATLVPSLILINYIILVATTLLLLIYATTTVVDSNIIIIHTILILGKKNSCLDISGNCKMSLLISNY